VNAFLVGSYVALWVLVVVLAAAVLALYNHFGAMYFSSKEGRAQQGPAPGTRLEAFSVRTLDDVEVTVAARRPALLLLASTDCPECGKLTSPLQRVAEEEAGRLDVVVLCGGPRGRVVEWARDHALGSPLHVVYDKNFRRAGDLGVGITPFLVGVDAHGTVQTRGWARFGRVGYAALFGFALGTGVLTVVPSAALYALLALAWSAPAWWQTYALVLAFASARAAMVPLLTARSMRTRVHPGLHSDRLRDAMARVGAVEATLAVLLALELLLLR
jgi:hypothetical protein